MSSVPYPPLSMPGLRVPDFHVKQEQHTMTYLQATTVGASEVSGTMYLRNNYRSDAPTPSEGLASEQPLMTEIRPIMAPEPPSVTSQNESFLHSSFQDIGKKVKAYNDTLGELHQLGIQSDVQLPELVLVGDQSAGKSTLMSGLAGLNLPRSGGVCTRCVIHIRISRSTEWSCRVSLREGYSFNPPARPITTRDVTNANPFPPWVRRGDTVTEFKTVTNTEEIESVIRWAQVAILNPGERPDLYVPGEGMVALHMTVDEAIRSAKAKFSPNVIAVDIRGPDYPDLSFYDLPGIFQAATESADDYLVDVVKRLAREYINHPRAILIGAVPMNMDKETSATLRLIRDLGAEDRTIGVVTKADIIPQDADSVENWVSTLRTSDQFCNLGYFVTARKPNLSLDEQQKYESQYFSRDSESWPREFATFRDRCGVENLKSFLSEKLGEEFGKSLPAIKSRVVAKLDATKAELRALPELPRNVELEVRRSLRDFCDAVKAKIGSREFSSNFYWRSEKFRDCLNGMKPRVLVSDPSDATNPSTPQDAICIDDDDDDSDHPPSSAPTPTPKRRGTNMAPPPQTPSKRARTNGSSAGPFVKNEDGTVNSHGGAPQQAAIPVHGLSRSARPSPSPSQAGSTDHGSGRNPFLRFGARPSRRLVEVRDAINKKRRAGMLGLVPEEVYKEFCKEAVVPWKEPMHVFLAETMKEIHGIIDDSMSESMATLKSRLIYKESQSLMRSFLADAFEEIRTLLERQYQIHTRQVFTVNQQEFDRYQKEELDVLNHYRHYIRWRASSFSGSAETQYRPWAAMSPEERVQDERTRLAQLGRLGEDLFSREIKVCAWVRGYYRLAAIRFTDTVALTVHSDLLPSISEKLDFFLEQRLGIWGPSHNDGVFERLMAEDESTARKREALKLEVIKFDRALESIRTLGVEANLHEERARSGTMEMEI